MHKTLVTIASAFAILSFGAVVSAQAGNGAPGTPAKYNNASHQTVTHTAASNGGSITEFSSSSYPANHGPKR